MKKKYFYVPVMAFLLSCAASLFVQADTLEGWQEIDGKQYWYENGIRQGYDTENPSYRGKEIYDKDSDAWYWLDNVQEGARAAGKDVYQESEAGVWGEYEDADGVRYGKWVRYDENGRMVKGWDSKEDGIWYFDITYGTMAKGLVEIDGNTYYFDEQTGRMQTGQVAVNGYEGYFDENTGAGADHIWITIDGTDYWYEAGVRQGYMPKDEGYRGREIYDPASDAWYWLDNVQAGAKAVSKDVYQESEAGAWGEYEGADGVRYGKWVRYDAHGQMVKGWDMNENGTYFFDYTYGTMAKGTVEIDGKTYHFHETTGILEEELAWYVAKETRYNSNDRVISENVYEYDDRGNCTRYTQYEGTSLQIIRQEQTEYDALDRIRWQKVQEYDNSEGYYLSKESESSYENGVLRTQKETFYTEEGAVSYIVETKYRTDGKTEKSSRYNADGALVAEFIHEYDEAGYLLAIDLKNIVNPDVSSRILYENDDRGRVQNMREYSYGGELMFSTVYTYDAVSGKVASYETRDEMRDFVAERREYDYNPQGFCTENRYYIRMTVQMAPDNSGYQYELRLRSRNTYRYDDEGNCLQTDAYTYSVDGRERHTSCMVYTYEHLKEQQTVVKTYDSYYEHSVIDENGYFVYDENGNVTYELGYNYGYENERNSEEVLSKQTYYIGGSGNAYQKTLNYWVEYPNAALPKAGQLGQTCQEKPYSTAYNADGSLRYYTVREYVACKR